MTLPLALVRAVVDAFCIKLVAIRENFTSYSKTYNKRTLEVFPDFQDFFHADVIALFAKKTKSFWTSVGYML